MKASILLILALISFGAAADKTNFSKSLPACDDDKIKESLYRIAEKSFLLMKFNVESFSRKEWSYSLENISVLGFNDFKNNQVCKAMFVLANKGNKNRVGFEVIYNIEGKTVEVKNFVRNFTNSLYDLRIPKK